MLRTGRPSFKYCFFRRAMFSNWALRFGLRGPMVFFFRAFRLRYPFLRSNWETTGRPAGVPDFSSRREICPRDKFVHLTSPRIGSPAVWSSSTFKKFASSSADISTSFLRPPPFFGHDSCPDRPSLPVPPTPGGWSWGRIGARRRRTRPHHAPASWTRWRHTADDRLQPASRRAASSSVRSSVHRRPCCTPPGCAPILGLDTRFQANREVISVPFLSDTSELLMADERVAHEVAQLRSEQLPIEPACPAAQSLQQHCGERRVVLELR